MNCIKFYLNTCAFIVFTINVNAQFENLKKIDSIKSVVENDLRDSNKVNALKAWSELIYKFNPAQDYSNLMQIKEICERQLSQKKLKDEELLFFKKKLGYSYNSLGHFFADQGNRDKTLYYYNKANKLYRENNDEKRLAKIALSLGNFYYGIDSIDKAQAFINKSLSIRKKDNDSSGLAKCLMLIGLSLGKEGNLDSALHLINQSIYIKTKIKDSSSLSTGFSNKGYIFQKFYMYDSALLYYGKAFILDSIYNNIYGLANTTYNIGSVKKGMNNYALAEIHYQKALAIATKNNYKELEKKITEDLYMIYKENNQFKEGLEIHEKYKSASDSINKTSADKRMQIIKFDNERILKNTELKAKKDEIKREKTKNLYLLIILTLIGIFSFIFYRNYRKTKKQKLIIEAQHEELNESHEELAEIHKQISDSIDYAKKIQDALLTSYSYMDKVLPHSFIFYKPKDVVSGDFYWAYDNGNGKLFFTVADCTGHGVPGAMVSMIGNALLNENIIDKKIYDPAIILGNMRDKVSELLNEEGIDNESRDGMHMALCCLNKKDMTLEYAGAFNPLIHITNGVLNEYKADSQPVALYTGDVREFTKHTIQLNEGDLLYLYSDGFQDQFGGERNKKYMAKRFKQFLLGISNNEIINQHELVKDEFVNWIGNEEQVDDVCIMGIKL